MTYEKDWIDILSALLTPTIAITATVVTIFQFKVNSNRLKYELFDRRYKQYQAVTNFLNSALRLNMRSSRAECSEDEERYLNGIQGIEFTFSKAVSAYLYKNV
jgi:hypothetical protein